MASAATSTEGGKAKSLPAPPPVLPNPVADAEEAALVELLAQHVPAPPPVLALPRGWAKDREHVEAMVDGMKKLASEEARRVMARAYEAMGHEKLNALLKSAGGGTVHEAFKNVGHMMAAIMAQPEMMARFIEWGFSQPGSAAAIISKWAPKDPGVTFNADKALILLPPVTASSEEWQAQAAKLGFTLQGQAVDTPVEPITIDGMGG